MVMSLEEYAQEHAIPEMVEPPKKQRPTRQSTEHRFHDYMNSLAGVGHTNEPIRYDGLDQVVSNGWARNPYIVQDEQVQITQEADNQLWERFFNAGQSGQLGMSSHPAPTITNVQPETLDGIIIQ